MKNTNELMKVITRIIELKKPVNMKSFRGESVESSRDALFMSINDCGTTGCILGWCPILGEGDLVPLAEDFSVMHGNLQFSAYASRVFSSEYDPESYPESDPDYCEDCGDEWDWLFGDEWPNSAEAAKVRLEYALENGFPEEYSYNYEECCVQCDDGTWKIVL